MAGFAWTTTTTTAPASRREGVAVPDDADLVAAARQDPQAFALLYERYVNQIFGYCYVQLGDRTAAEDATSEVFLKALQALKGFRNGIFAAWLLTIARHTVIDLRRRKRATTPIDDAAGWLPDPGHTPETAAVDRAERVALRKAIADLPDDQRAAIELQMAGWSGEQIANALGKTPAAVYMLRVRALARMEKSLAKAGWGSGDGRPSGTGSAGGDALTSPSATPVKGARREP